MDAGFRQLIKLQMLTQPAEIIVSEGEVFNEITKSSNSFRLSCGWDLLSAYDCDQQWTAFRLKISMELAKMSKEARDIEMANIQDEDGHWEWFNKSFFLKSDEYKWFFFKIDDHIEAACLIYHPSPSISSPKKVFYIEFIAVAPWNRYNPLSKNRYKGIGTTFLKNIMIYCTNVLKFEPGMSLHSLPQAAGFYEQKLGMIHYDQADKHGMNYYEMHENTFDAFIRS